MRGFGWLGVILGAGVSLVLVRGYGFVYERIILPLGHRISEAGQPTNVLAPPRLVDLESVIFVAAVLLAPFLGGLLAGRLSASRPGFDGILTAALSAIVGLATYWNIAYSAFTSPEYEDTGLLFLHIFVRVVFFPFTALAAYLGGRTGGRLRDTSRRAA